MKYAKPVTAAMKASQTRQDQTKKLTHTKVTKESWSAADATKVMRPHGHTALSVMQISIKSCLK